MLKWIKFFLVIWNLSITGQKSWAWIKFHRFDQLEIGYPSLGRNHYHWSSIGDPLERLVGDPQIPQSFVGDPKIFIGDHKVSLETPRLSLETPRSPWRSQSFVGDPQISLKTLKFRRRPPDFRWRPHLLVWDPQILVGDSNTFIGGLQRDARTPGSPMKGGLQ